MKKDKKRIVLDIAVAVIVLAAWSVKLGSKEPNVVRGVIFTLINAALFSMVYLIKRPLWMLIGSALLCVGLSFYLNDLFFFTFPIYCLHLTHFCLISGSGLAPGPSKSCVSMINPLLIVDMLGAIVLIVYSLLPYMDIKGVVYYSRDEMTFLTCVVFSVFLVIVTVFAVTIKPEKKAKRSGADKNSFDPIPTLRLVFPLAIAVLVFTFLASRSHNSNLNIPERMTFIPFFCFMLTSFLFDGDPVAERLFDMIIPPSETRRDMT